jgi:hypothetical protein
MASGAYTLVKISQNPELDTLRIRAIITLTKEKI